MRKKIILGVKMLIVIAASLLALRQYGVNRCHGHNKTGLISSCSCRGLMCSSCICLY